MRELTKQESMRELTDKELDFVAAGGLALVIVVKIGHGKKNGGGDSGDPC
ncbi:hypothetical protein [Ensifer aridi]|nr:hypothetical protein [Ensifer aridi]